MKTISDTLNAIASNISLRDESNFEARAQAIDALEFLILQESPQRAEAMALRDVLEEADQQLFNRLRAEIRDGLRGADLRKRTELLVPSTSKLRPAAKYDTLDLLMSGVLLARPLPDAQTKLQREMVAYQRTPSRIVFELTQRISFADHDVFYDLGSGLGEVAIVVHLLTSAKTKGVEIEPAYCDYARALAADLNLPDVHFVNDDARRADVTDGTIFFLYTPFRGAMLADVLDRICVVAGEHPVTVFTYGPCSGQVAQESWLRRLDEQPISDEVLCRFAGR